MHRGGAPVFLPGTSRMRGTKAGHTFVWNPLLGNATEVLHGPFLRGKPYLWSMTTGGRRKWTFLLGRKCYATTGHA